MFQAEVLAISEETKNPFLEKMHNQSIVVLVDAYKTAAAAATLEKYLAKRMMAFEYGTQ